MDGYGFEVNPKGNYTYKGEYKDGMKHGYGV